MRDVVTIGATRCLDPPNVTRFHENTKGRGCLSDGLRNLPHTWVEWSCSQLLQNTPLHPIAEWGRQRFGGADGRRGRTARAVLSSQRLKLQTSYGQAMIHARGYSAPETTAAFARARELTAGVEDAAERFSIYYGLWVGNFVRGELAPMRDIAEIIKGEVEGMR